VFVWLFSQTVDVSGTKPIYILMYICTFCENTWINESTHTQAYIHTRR